ncbi:unnamed protein product [Prunus armeniaca]
MAGHPRITLYDDGHSATTKFVVMLVCLGYTPIDRVICIWLRGCTWPPPKATRVGQHRSRRPSWTPSCLKASRKMMLTELPLSKNTRATS